MLVASFDDAKPGFPKQLLESREGHGVITAMELPNDRSGAGALFGEAKREIVLIAFPSPHLLCGIDGVSDRSTAIRAMVRRSPLDRSVITRGYEKDAAGNEAPSAFGECRPDLLIGEKVRDGVVAREHRIERLAERR